MRRAFLVVGPESSGTRVVTRLFVEAGCIGMYSHNQNLDGFVQGKSSLSEGEDLNFVLRRSIPHGAEFSDYAHIDRKFCESGCTTLWIVLFREWFALSRSKLRQGHARKQGEADMSIVPQLKHIFQFLVESGPNFIIVDTSLLFIRPRRVLRHLENITGLKFNEGLIKDADKKYEAVNV